MLRIADVLLFIVHLAILGFNLLGWIWPKTRRLHLIVVLITAFCWLILGIWYGIGYCPVTDLQWRVKEQLGEHNLPGSFVTYCLQAIGLNISGDVVSAGTGIAFAMAGALALYFNIVRPLYRRFRLKPLKYR